MLSVIISTPTTEGPLVRTLAALVPGATAGVVQDVILVDGTNSAMAARVADVSGARHFRHDGLAGEALAAAARSSRTPWLLFLKAGTGLEANWIDEAVAFIREEGGSFAASRAAVFHHARAPYAPRKIANNFATLRRLLLGPGADQGLLISRGHYERLGGHAATATDPENDLTKRVRRRARVTLRSRIFAGT